MNKKLLSIIALCLIMLTTACTKEEKTVDTMTKINQRGKIIVGVKYDTKPFGYLNEKHQLVGLDIDLAKHIAKSILGDENKIEFKPVTPSNRILALNSGQVDMIIATMTITPSRLAVIDFSIPYYLTGQSLLVPKNSDVRSITDLNGKKVIIIFGSTAEKNLRLAAPDATIMGFKTYTSGYEALKEGKADAMTSDDTILLGFAMSDKSVKLLPKKYSKEPYAVAFKKGKESLRLQNEVNLILKDMTANGTLESLKHKWTQR